MAQQVDCVVRSKFLFLSNAHIKLKINLSHFQREKDTLRSALQYMSQKSNEKVLNNSFLWHKQINTSNYTQIW